MSDLPPDAPPAAVEAPVRYGRLKILGVIVIGALIAFQGLSDADHLHLLGPKWSPPARPLAAVLLGAFYTLERYLSKSATWYKPDPVG